MPPISPSDIAQAAAWGDQNAVARNVVQARSFPELREQAIRRYQNRAIETAQVIEGGLRSEAWARAG
jgi:hypothetical protein